MYRLSFCLLFVACSLFSCSSEKEDLKTAIAGNWLILYPDHQLKTKSEREVYGKYQDSIVNLLGLKLITLDDNGEFTEMDSLFNKKGQWQLSGEKDLQLREGGKGFNSFTTEIEGLDNDTLRLIQYLPLEKEKIKVVWHLKKVGGDTLANNLLTEEGNQWRKKPVHPETEKEIRNRLAGLLNYYSNYLKLVSKESSYFLIPRIHLPFRYYQHAIGMAPQMSKGFVNLFYDENDARKAYLLLDTTVNQLANEFKWASNFVEEYGLFFKRMTYSIAD
jgi:hypothetical protein